MLHPGVLAKRRSFAVRVAQHHKPAFTIAQEARRAAKDFSESL